jgi:hypothetical protein
MTDLFELWSWTSNESIPVPPPVCQARMFLPPMTQG